MPNLNLLPSNRQSDGAWASAVPSSIRTTAATAAAAAEPTKGPPAMGQKEFLTLFTTQLKNQDPLDPVKNEAFVAQLAQFSQLEATTNMSSTLTSFVDSMSGAQVAGDLSFAWDGKDEADNTLPNGDYRFAVTAVSQGKTITPKVSTQATVIGISQQPDKSMLLQVQGGKTLKLSDVKRIDG